MLCQHDMLLVLHANMASCYAMPTWHYGMQQKAILSKIATIPSTMHAI